MAENPREITRTGESMRYPWPTDCFVQGGRRGVVFRGDQPSYRTAFVEAFPRNPNTFIRGEGATVAEAEDHAWQQYETLTACPTHPEHGPWDRRQYRNGAAYCTNCGTWFSSVLPELPPDPDTAPSFMERLLAGDEEALTTTITAIATLDSLPTAEKDAR